MTETVELELNKEEVNRLLKVLNANVGATGETDALRWTNAAASRIDRVRQTIEEQTNVE